VAFKRGGERKVRASGESDNADDSKHLKADLIIGFGPATWSNWVLIVVAGIAAYLAVKTLKAIHRQADIADRAIVVGRQPHLVATNFRLGGVSVGSATTPSVIYDLKNYGLGPAFVEYLTVICEIRDGLKQPPSYLGASIQVSTLGRVIGPSEAINDITTLCGSSLDNPENATREESEYKQVFGGLCEQHFFLYGYVLYDDIFDRGHVTGFAAMWDHERGMRLTSASEASGYNYAYEIKGLKRESFWRRNSHVVKRWWRRMTKTRLG